MTFFQKRFSFQTFLVSGFPNHKLSFKQKRIHNIFILWINISNKCTWDLNANLVQILFYQCICMLYFTTIKNKWWRVSIWQLHRLHIPVEYLMRKRLCSVNNIVYKLPRQCLITIEAVWIKTDLQTDFQFMSLSCNFTYHLLSVSRGSLNCWER